MITGRESQQTTNAAPPPIVFTSCELQDAAQAHAQLAAAAGAQGGGTTQAASRRREVKVNGKRVRTIDIHCHAVVPETLELCKHSSVQRGPGIEEVGERRIREMDEMGVDLGVISINPYWYN